MWKLAVALSLVVISTPARTETEHLGVQYTLPAGFSQDYGGCQLSNASQCFKIPVGKSVKQCTGTHSIKIPNVELLAFVYCGTSWSDAEPIWVGHHLSSSPTVQWATPPLPGDSQFLGDGVRACWVGYEAINSGQSSVPNGGWELQGVCSVQ